MIGIYKITNNINGKIYVGQSWDIENRFRQHKINEKNRHLKSAYECYGMENFSFDAIKIFENTNDDMLTEAECFYIKFYDAQNREKGYNIREASSKGKHSEESKKIMSEYWVGKRIGEDNYNFGKHFTEEHKQKISNSEKGKVIAADTRKKMSEAKKGKKLDDEHRNKVIKTLMKRDRKVKNIDTNEVFASIKEASEKCGCSREIGAVCVGKRKTCGGFRWIYVD